MATAQPATELTEVFELLKNKRRMKLVEYLADCATPTDLGTVADRFAELEDDERSFSKRRKSEYVSLYQSHLPKLDDAGVVEFDRQSKQIDTGPHFDRVHDVLQAASRGVATKSAVDRVRTLLA